MNTENISVTGWDDEVKSVIYDELSHSLGQERPVNYEMLSETR